MSQCLAAASKHSRPLAPLWLLGALSAPLSWQCLELGPALLHYSSTEESVSLVLDRSWLFLLGPPTCLAPACFLGEHPTLPTSPRVGRGRFGCATLTLFPAWTACNPCISVPCWGLTPGLPMQKAQKLGPQASTVASLAVTFGNLTGRRHLSGHTALPTKEEECSAGPARRAWPSLSAQRWGKVVPGQQDKG